MAGDKIPSNRKERRAAAAATAKSKDPSNSIFTSATDIPMAQPDRSGPKSKTLFQLADERQALLNKGQPFSKKYSDGNPRDESGNILFPSSDENPVGPIGEALFYTITLSMLHFTLDVLVYSQYRQSIEWTPIFTRTATILPALFLLIYLPRSKYLAGFALLKQVFYLCTAVGAGCYMIFAGNKYDYYAVMKQAPPVGTLWVWSVIEMRLEFAVVSVLIDLGYLWWNGFSAF